VAQVPSLSGSDKLAEYSKESNAWHDPVRFQLSGGFTVILIEIPYRSYGNGIADEDVKNAYYGQK